MAAGQIQRSDVFVTTKVALAPAHSGADSAKSLGLENIGRTVSWSLDIEPFKQAVRVQIEKALDELMMGFVDLLLMHFPGPGGSTDEALNHKMRLAAWDVFEEYYQSGKLRAIGVSNFTKRHLELFLKDVKTKPMVNQLEISPYYTQTECVEYCQQNDILVQAWSPLGSGATGVLTDPLIKSLSEKYKKNVGQVVLRWHYQKGICPLPKSSDEAEMRGNLDIFDFELTADEVASITGLNKDRSTIPPINTA